MIRAFVKHATAATLLTHTDTPSPYERAVGFHAWAALVRLFGLMQMALLTSFLYVSPADAVCYVLFTVDVETRSIGTPNSDIWGILPGETERHGIERMMDILDQHGVKGTFFVNVYEAPKHGSEAMREVCCVIHQRGHDLELHTHPKPMFGVSYMQMTDLAAQTQILARGKSMIREWTGVDVVAHRAGSYMANFDTVRACGQAGIPVECSYNIVWSASDLGRAGLTQNAPVVYEGVLVVPVSAYVQASVGGWRSMRFLDIESSSPDEIRRVVSELKGHDVRTAVIMMHSFSFVRFGKPNLRAENSLEKVLDAFALDPDVRIVTARQLHDIWRANPGALQGGDYLPTTGWWMTYCRAWQRLDEGWKNVAVAAAPPATLALVGSIGGLVWRRRRRRAVAARIARAAETRPDGRRSSHGC